MEPAAPDNECTFCNKHFEYEPISLNVGPYDAQLCGWLCIIAYASVRAKEQRDALEERARELESDNYLLDFYRAGCL